MGSATLLERALGAPKPPADPASERILDAALEIAAASGIRALTMDSVARRAGVGRMTVYRRFGEREAVVDALAAREARRCLAELDRAVDPSLPVPEGIARGLATSLRLIRDHPLLRRLAAHEPEAALAALNASEGALVALSREFVAGRLREAAERGEIGQAGDLDAVAELLVRIGFSFLLLPQSAIELDDAELVAAFARGRIAAMLGR